MSAALSKPTFVGWWLETNRQLELLGERDAVFGDAREFFARQWSPRGAAEYIRQERVEARAAA
ncbi:MAG: hypothetical protein ACJ8HI_08355 [Massilia sp.]